MMCNEGQPFGANYNPLYSGKGLKGHTGEDWDCGWGTPITSQYDGFVYKVFGPSNTPNRDGYTEVDIIVDNGIECFEWQVGHCNPTIQANIDVKKGDTIATEANHGPVYSGNIFITIPMQKAGDQRGAHRHYQKRPLYKTSTGSGHYLTGFDGGTYKKDGYYYVVWDYFNGYNGCIDPSLPTFNRLLSVGMSGYDIYVLQRLLRVDSPTGFFGSKTFAAVKNMQSVNNITPFGFVGPATRALLNSMLSPLPILSGE